LQYMNDDINKQDEYVNNENLNEEYTFSERENDTPAYEKKELRGKSVSSRMLVLCVVLSLVFGMIGGVTASKIILSNDESVKTKVIYQAVETNFEGESLDVSEELSYEDIAAIASSSVVEIKTEKVATDAWFGQYITSGAGSGVIITDGGYIITNHHVIENAKSITVVLFNGNSYEAQLVGSDKKTDMAVIRIDTEEQLTPAILGDSDVLSVGNKVVAIGNPLGTLGGTVTEGIISALDREIVIDGESMALLQTTAAVNPGNSGGGLFDGHGHLVGIVNAKPNRSNIEGLGFAIPINDVKSVIENIIDFGYVRGRVALGITVIEITDERTAMSYRVDDYGVYIIKVEEGSSAHIAGLEPGDHIMSADDVVINTGDDLKEILQSHSVGDKLNLVINRSGNTHKMDILLGEDTPDKMN